MYGKLPTNTLSLSVCLLSLSPLSRSFSLSLSPSFLPSLKLLSLYVQDTMAL